MNFSDGSSAVVPSTTTGDYGYLGITADSAPLTQMTIVGTGGATYLNFSNFSTAVPEPSSIVLAVMGTAGLAAAAARRRRRHG
jgi:MYXO-CTERM domain-containing protein